jgi:hypothetical protein
MSAKGKEKMATDRIEGMPSSKDGVLKQYIPPRLGQPNRTASLAFLVSAHFKWIFQYVTSQCQPKPPPSPSISANRTNSNIAQPSLPNISHISLARQTLVWQILFH